MTEADVALTDYALALECAVFCVLAARWRTSVSGLQRWWIVFFASIGAASLFGGTVHGFFQDVSTAGYAILWPATLLAIGATSLATWMVGAHLLLREPGRSWLRRAAIVLLVLYVGAVFVSQAFIVAIAAYLPATLFLLVAMVNAYRGTGQHALGYGIVGLVLTFVAAAVQQLRVAIHPVYFNHNALYHVIQAVALFLIFIAARATTAHRSEPTDKVQNDSTA